MHGGRNGRQEPGTFVSSWANRSIFPGTLPEAIKGHWTREQWFFHPTDQAVLSEGYGCDSHVPVTQDCP